MSINMKHSTIGQRYVIASVHKRCLQQKEIAIELGTSESTNSRELKQNATKRFK